MNLFAGTLPTGYARQTMRLYAGQAGVTLPFAAKDLDGTPYALAGITATLYARLGGVYAINAAAMTVDTEPTGMLSYTLAAGELSAFGRYDCQIRLSNGVLLEPFTIEAQESLVGDAPTVPWTQIRVYGKKWTTPNVYQWRIDVDSAIGAIASMRVHFKTYPPGPGTDYNSVESPAWMASGYGASWPWTGNSQVQQLFQLLLENVTLADGSFITTADTGITLDTNNFTAGGTWIYYTPGDLIGTATVADPPADPAYDLENP